MLNRHATCPSRDSPAEEMTMTRRARLLAAASGFAFAPSDDKGSVPVTKCKTTKNMARGATSGVQFASYFPAQSQYIGTMWIGYGYIDEWGNESINGSRTS
jgi:hypothetical protein